MKRLICIAAGLAGASLILSAQNPDIAGIITKDAGRPYIAIPDFKGSGDAQNFMGAFNQTLWDDVSGAGTYRMAAKTMYPLNVPQQPSDFAQTPLPGDSFRGRNLSDWSGPPVS